MKKIIGIAIGLVLLPTICFATFSDMKEDSVYTVAIEDLVERGVINGYEDNTFRPSQTITRAEMTKMLVTAKEVNATATSSFDDVPENHWAKRYIDLGVASGYIKGDGDGKFRPEDSVTYGEVATMLVRAMGYEKEALASSAQWPYNFMQYAQQLKLTEDIQTNDFLAVNPARRDNVALMIYHVLQSLEEEEENNDPKVDTKTAYTGFVDKVYNLNGARCISVKDSSGNSAELKLYGNTVAPEKKSFVVYQFKTADEIRIRKELATADLDTNFLKVVESKEDLVTFEGEEKVLDLELKEYVLGDKTYRLDKYKYIMITYNPKKDEFTSFDLLDRKDLELQENDKVRFENDLNICFVIRED